MTQSYLRSAKVTPTLSPGGAGRGAQDIARRLRLGLRRIRLRSSSAFAATSRPGVQKPHCSAACSRKQNDAAALFEARRSTSPGCPASQVRGRTCRARNHQASIRKGLCVRAGKPSPRLRGSVRGGNRTRAEDLVHQIALLVVSVATHPVLQQKRPPLARRAPKTGPPAMLHRMRDLDSGN